MTKHEKTASVIGMLSGWWGNNVFGAEQEVTQVAVQLGEPALISTVRVLELLGVYLMLAGMLGATVYFIWELLKKPSFNQVFLHFREHFVQAILLGLEILMVANLINAVVLEPGLDSFVTLFVVLAIRTVLSFCLTVEVHGFWPWDRKRVLLQKKTESEHSERDHAEPASVRHNPGKK